MQLNPKRATKILYVNGILQSLFWITTIFVVPLKHSNPVGPFFLKMKVVAHTKAYFRGNSPERRDKVYKQWSFQQCFFCWPSREKLFTFEQALNEHLLQKLVLLFILKYILYILTTFISKNLATMTNSKRPRKIADYFNMAETICNYFVGLRKKNKKK